MDFVAGLGSALWQRVFLSYKSTILGLLVLAVGETLHYAYVSVPNPYVHGAIALLTTIFLSWKDKKTSEGALKMLVVLFLFSAGARAAPNPEALKDAIAEDPGAVQPEPPSTSTVSGCVGVKKNVCFAPQLSVTLMAVNFSTKKIEGAFAPGIGYGFTVNPGKWSSFGAGAHFVLDPGAQQAGAGVVASFLNNLFKVGFDKGFIGDKAWRLLVGTGLSVPL